MGALRTSVAWSLVLYLDGGALSGGALAQATEGLVGDVIRATEGLLKTALADGHSLILLLQILAELALKILPAVSQPLLGLHFGVVAELALGLGADLAATAPICGETSLALYGFRALLLLTLLKTLLGDPLPPFLCNSDT